MSRARFLNKYRLNRERPGFGRGVLFVSVLIISDCMKLSGELTEDCFWALKYCFCLVCVSSCVSVPAEKGLTGKAGAPLSAFIFRIIVMHLKMNVLQS